MHETIGRIYDVGSLLDREKQGYFVGRDQVLIQGCDATRTLTTSTSLEGAPVVGKRSRLSDLSSMHRATLLNYAWRHRVLTAIFPQQLEVSTVP